MCRASRSEIPWHKCQVTSSAGWIRNEGPCCHRCVLKLVPSILLLLEDGGCGYSFQEGVTGMSTSSWKEIKHKAATAPMYVVHWHLQGHCYLRKMGSKPEGTENFINCSVFYIIRKAGLTLALLENSGFKGGGDRHVPNAWVTLPWSCFGINTCGVERNGWNIVSMKRVWKCWQRVIIWKQIPHTLKCPFHCYPFWDTSSLQLLESKVYLMEKKSCNRESESFLFLSRWAPQSV